MLSYIVLAGLLPAIMAKPISSTTLRTKVSMTHKIKPTETTIYDIPTDSDLWDFATVTVRHTSTVSVDGDFPLETDGPELPFKIKRVVNNHHSISLDQLPTSTDDWFLPTSTDDLFLPTSTDDDFPLETEGLELPFRRNHHRSSSTLDMPLPTTTDDEVPLETDGLGLPVKRKFPTLPMPKSHHNRSITIDIPLPTKTDDGDLPLNTVGLELPFKRAALTHSKSPKHHTSSSTLDIPLPTETDDIDMPLETEGLDSSTLDIPLPTETDIVDLPMETEDLELPFKNKRAFSVPMPTVTATSILPSVASDVPLPSVTADCACREICKNEHSAAGIILCLEACIGLCPETPVETGTVVTNSI